MKVWYVENSNGDKTYFSDYKEAHVFMEIQTEPLEEEITDEEWESAFRINNHGMLRALPDSFYEQKKEVVVGKWSLKKEEMSKEDFEKLID